MYKIKIKFLKMVFIFTSLISLVMITVWNHKINALSIDPEKCNTYGIGKPIKRNIKNGYEIVNLDVLDESFYEEETNYIEIYENYQQNLQSSEITSLKNIRNDIDRKFSLDNNLGIEYDDMKINAGLLISANHKSEYENNSSNYFYTLNAENSRYTARLTNSLEYELIRENLSSNFINHLEELFENDNYYGEQQEYLIYKNFFENYGCHLLVSGTFGGKIQLIHSFFSNNYNVKNLISTTYESEMKLIINEIKAGKKINVSLTKIFNLINGKAETNFSRQTTGGNYPLGHDLKSTLENFSQWQKSIENNEMLISIPENGAIPFWKILPHNYNYYKYIDKMKNYYLKFCEETKKLPFSQSEMVNFDASGNTLLLETKKFSNTKNYDKTHITDAGYIKNEVNDLLKFKNVFLNEYNENVYSNDKDIIDKKKKNFNVLKYIKNNGFNKLSITVILDVKEIFDGYQYIAIFTENDSFLRDKYFEHGRHKRNTFKQRFHIELGEFSIYNFIDDDSIKIRYNASGYSADDWLRSNVRITMRFYK